MVLQQAVEERLVAVLQGDHADILFDIGRLALDIPQGALHLGVDAVDRRRDQPFDVQGATLVGTEAGSLVEQRIGQNVDPAFLGLDDQAAIPLLNEIRRHRDPPV